MVADPFSGSLVLKLANPIIKAAAAGMFKRIKRKGQVGRAITATTAEFPGIENIDYSLRKWCQDPAFVKLFVGARGGSLVDVTAALVDSFLTVTDFYLAEDTNEVVSTILATFLTKLSREILGDDGALFVHDQREAERFEVIEGAVTSGLRETAQELASLSRTVAQLQSQLSSAPTVVAASEVQYHAILDETRVLLDSGDSEAARGKLQELRAQLVGVGVSVNVQFRLSLNLGCCEVERGAYAEAAIEFDRAIQLCPDSSKALANRAYVAAFLEDFVAAREYLDRARSAAPDDEYTRAVTVLLFVRAKDWESLERVSAEQPEVLERPDTGVLIAESLLVRGDHPRALTILKGLEAGHPDDPQVCVILAQALVAPLRTEVEGRSGMAGFSFETAAEQLRAAETLLTRAIECGGDRLRPARRRITVVMRAEVRTLLNLDQAAYDDCQAVLSENPGDTAANRALALLHLRAGRAERAVACLEAIPASVREPSVSLMLATAYLDAEDWQAAAAAARLIVDSSEDQGLWLEAADILFRVHEALGDLVAAKQFEDDIAHAKFPAVALVAAARHHARTERRGSAVSLLQAACDQSVGKQQEGIAFELASALGADGRFDEALAIYRARVSPEHLTPEAILYATAAFNAGKFREALGLVRRLRADGDAIRKVSEIEALVLEYIDDVEGAAQLRVRLAALEPDRPVHVLKLTELEIRRGREDAARRVIERLSVEDAKGDPDVLLKIAQLRSYLRMPNVLEFAYAARDVAVNRSDIHSAYMWLVVNRGAEDSNGLDIDASDVDTVVVLKRENEIRRFHLVRDCGAGGDLRRGDVEIDSDLGKCLMGRAKGDIVTIREGALDERSYEVVDVLSKYVAACHETVENFATWFPGDRALAAIEFRDNDYSKLFVQLDESNRHTEVVTQTYIARRLPLEMVAKALGMSRLRVLEAFMSPDGPGLLVENGLPGERDRARAVLETSSGVVLDLTGAAVIRALGLWEPLRRRFPDLIVPQAVVDELSEILRRDFSQARPAMMLGKSPDGYVKAAVDEARYADAERATRDLREALLNEARTVAIPRALDEPKDEFMGVIEVVGKSTVAVALASVECGYPIYADDIGLRMLAKERWGVEGVSTQGILEELRRTQEIDDNIFFRAMEGLVAGHHEFVGVTPEFAVWVLKTETEGALDRFKLVLARLAGGRSDDASAIGCAAGIIKGLWLERDLASKRRDAIGAVLQALSQGRDRDAVLGSVMDALRVACVLVPESLKAIGAEVSWWRENCS